MYKLALHPSAKDIDIAGLWATEPIVAAKVVAMLELIRHDQSFLNSLTDHGFGHNQTAAIHVSKWQEFWTQNIDLWRFKIWELEKRGLQYRVIYFYHFQERCYYVLAVVHRDFDYDPQHPITKRILRDCAAF